MRRAWIGVVGLAVVVLLLAGCVGGGVVNPVKVFDLEIVSSTEDVVTVKGLAQSNALAANSEVSVEVTLWLTRPNGSRIPETDRSTTEGLADMKYRGANDIRAFTIELPNHDEFNGTVSSIRWSVLEL